MEDYVKEAIDTTFSKDAINSHRDSIIGRMVVFNSEQDITDYVNVMFQEKVDWVKRAFGIEDFGGSNYATVRYDWAERIKEFLKEPYIIKASPHMRVAIAHPMFGTIETEASWDGQGILSFGYVRFFIANQLEDDMEKILAYCKEREEKGGKRYHVERDDLEIDGLFIDGSQVAILYRMGNKGSCRGADRPYTKGMMIDEKNAFVIHKYADHEVKVFF